MRKKNWHSFVVSHQLVNRVYDMLDYFNFFENRVESEQILKKKIDSKMNSIYYIENLASYFERKLKKHYKNVEIRCNLVDLLYDLDHLKQYLTVIT